MLTHGLNMEGEQAYPNSHHDDADQDGDGERGKWQSRLRLRKSSASSLTVKSLTEEEKVVSELSKEPPQNEHLHQRVLNSSAGKLTFTCSNCKDGTAFSPQGLLDHFTVFHGGKGEPPAFACDVCKFASPEFPVLQQHRMKHRQCRFACEICNDSVLQTLAQLKKHCKTKHSLNRQYHCEKCKFSTKELKSFAYHSCPASTSLPIESTEKSDIKPVNGELNRNHVAGADLAPQTDKVIKQLSTDCQRWRRRTWWRKKEVPPKHQDVGTPDLLPKPPETPWTSSGILRFSADLLDENSILLNPNRTLEETQQFLERTVNSGKKWPISLKAEPELAPQSCIGPLPSQPKMKQKSIPVPGLKNYVNNKLSGLMEKNNVSVPPDCTTKVVGLKMVDGKQHLIVKVIPPTKPDVRQNTEVSPGLNCTEFNGRELISKIERSVDQMCAELCTKKACNATSGSLQPHKPSEKLPIAKDPTDGSTQADNTGHGCNKDSSTLTEYSDNPPQLAVSGTREGFNVANRNNSEKQLMSPGVMTDSNSTHHLSGGAANVAVEESSLGEVDAQILSDKHTKTLSESQEKALDDMKENCPELTTNHNDSGCHGDFACSILSDLSSLKESQLSVLMSEEDGNPYVDSRNMDKTSGEDASVMPSYLLRLNEQKIDKTLPNVSSFSSTCFPEKGALCGRNNINPAFVSLHNHTTELLLNSPSEEIGLLFQDSGDEYTNNVDSRDVPVPLDQSCTTETVEEPNYLAISLLGDSCHNPDLYQTIEELPVTTVNHLLDGPKVASIGITNQSCEGRLSAYQAGLQSPKAIPVNEKDSVRSNVYLSPANESAMKRKRTGESTAKDSERPISKSRKQTVQRSQENDPPASVPYWEPVPQTVEKTLRLLPLYPSQPIKVPCLNQPVIVLNHPDTDIPEVANIMRIVNKHKGAVQKVKLSQGTLKALSEFNCDAFRKALEANCHSSHCRRVWPQATVKERFILKLKLKRLCGNKFKVTPPTSEANRYQLTFRCWFCGRHFTNQEEWVGHGQRHLMEATRDWNELFSSDGQHESTIEPYSH